MPVRAVTRPRVIAPTSTPMRVMWRQHGGLLSAHAIVGAAVTATMADVSPRSTGSVLQPTDLLPVWNESPQPPIAAARPSTI
ncbi:hypothetical protein [Rhodococcoides fascians]|uniref:hypothetical protein n=1 Tax=Rhodococcoides fascians TaxID=1828 RepID=UPI000561A8A0|nr:hypothetical protein [Rhodococcus fascians]